MPTSHAILCRYGELFLKRGNRGRFLRRLQASANLAVRGLRDARVDAPYGRLLVSVAEADLEEACTRLSRVFGLVSLSPVVRVAAAMPAIAEAAVSAARAALAGPTPPQSFKIEATRSDKRFPVASPIIAREIGAAVFEATNLRVDVHKPDLHIGVEVRTDGAFIFGGTRPAPGGLPVGSAGRGLLLLSGGIDSPVAGWLAAKRGLGLDAIHFHSPPFVGEKAKDKVIALARILAGWQAVDSVIVVQFAAIQEKLREAGAGELAVVLYRRMMMRIADAIADRTGAVALVTGENLGQVASQTIENITAIEDAARRPILRPLITYDKVETTLVARRIGTYETSVLPFEDCCSLFVPAHPATAAKLPFVQAIESRLDVAAEVATAAATAERITLD